MSVRQKIREYLDASDGPQWGAEIIAATGCSSRDLSRMVADGTLIKHAGQAPAYAVGKRPRVAMTPEQLADAHKQAWRKQDAKRRAQRAAEGKQRRRTKSEQPAVKRVQIVLASKHATVGGESVADFLKRGGKIDRLPGFQRDNIYPQRRPQMANYRSMA